MLRKALRDFSDGEENIFSMNWPIVVAELDKNHLVPASSHFPPVLCTERLTPIGNRRRNARTSAFWTRR